MTVRRLTPLFLVALLLAGCGPTAPKKIPVKGQVTLDGKAMPQGEITFSPVDGAVPETLPVTDGKFEGQLTSGKKKVAVNSYVTVQTPKNVPGGGGEAKRSIVVDRYNTLTTLTAEVGPSGVSPDSFAVTTK